MRKSQTKKILCIMGTRPEVIKMAPIIWALKKEPWVNLKILATAQHREMLDQMLTLFDIKVDHDLNIMTKNQTLPDLTASLIKKLSPIFESEKPDAVLSQGDTTTVFVSALLSFYYRVPFGHVEAGLRTHNIDYPFPEEANRVLTARLATWHFAPTLTSKKALLKENIDKQKIFVTGNTVIDTLLEMTKKIKKTKSMLLPKEFSQLKNLKNKKIILVTAHRRENFGQNFLNICKALKKIAAVYSDIVEIIYPVHLNPSVHKIAHQLLKNCSGITLCKPLDYLPFIQLMNQSYCIITDSGGIQEEAPALSKPVLVCRNETERPEAVSAGVVKLVGLDADRIFNETEKLLLDPKYYARMAKGVSPYGDGKASLRIVKILEESLR